MPPLLWQSALQAEHDPGSKNKEAWNAGRKPGAKRALKPKEVWAIRFWLDHKGS